MHTMADEVDGDGDVLTPFYAPRMGVTAKPLPALLPTG